MSIININRVKRPRYTIGLLYTDNGFECFTVELPTETITTFEHSVVVPNDTIDADMFDNAIRLDDLKAGLINVLFQPAIGRQALISKNAREIMYNEWVVPNLPEVENI